MNFRNVNKFLLFGIFLLLFFKGGRCEDPDLFVEGDFEDFYINTIDNIYLVSSNQAIIKYNRKGKEQFTINPKILGRLGSADVSNSLELLFYYPDPNTAVITDNTLSEKRRIDVNDLGFNRTTLAARSTEKGIWIYDENNINLKRITQNGKVLNESNQLLQFTQGDLNPTSLRSRTNRIYLNAPAQGIIMFDNFGNYLKTIPVKGVRTFEVSNDVLWYWKKGKVGSYDLKRFKRKKVNLPLDTLPANAKSIRYTEKALFVLDKHGLKVYK